MTSSGHPVPATHNGAAVVDAEASTNGGRPSDRSAASPIFGNFRVITLAKLRRCV
jgi:hypothetical protein